MNSITILSYNIHKGFTTGNRKFILEDIKKSIQNTEADLVCLQEVIGSHTKHFQKIKNWPSASQFEYLADQTWQHFVYGKNAIYPKGDHGNALLSKYPVIEWSNQNISTKYERRGLLHVVLNIDDINKLHVFCIHLGLFEKDRKNQLAIIIETINSTVPSDAPLLVAGDFNDWHNYATGLLHLKLNMQEAFISMYGKVAITFPAKLPILRLDRIYYRNLKCISAKLLKDKIWKKLSDHLPLIAKFEII